MGARDERHARRPGRGRRDLLGRQVEEHGPQGTEAGPRQGESGSDILGDAYEYLIGKFADITRRKKAGEFYTPRSVVRMMIELLDPQEGESIYDPACGTGGMLLGAIEHVERAGGDPRTFFGRIFGEEKNLTTSSIARMNFVLHGVEDFRRGFVAMSDRCRIQRACPSMSSGQARLTGSSPPISLTVSNATRRSSGSVGSATAALPRHRCRHRRAYRAPRVRDWRTEITHVTVCSLLGAMTQ